MNTCVTSKILRGVPFEEIVRFVKTAGFNELDMSLEPSFLLAADWKHELDERLRLCEKADIRIRYAHMPYFYPARDDEAGWKDFYTASCRAADFAVTAGVDCAAIHPRAFTVRDYNHEKERADAIEFLEPYQDYALRKGLTLALENMRGAGQSADPALRRLGTEVQDVISMADELGMGICWDTGHANISAQDQRSSIIAIGSRLKEVHLNDNWAEDDIHLPVTMGNSDWTGVARGLKSISFTGSLNTEVSCERVPEMLRASQAQYMYRSVKWFEKLIADQP